MSNIVPIANTTSTYNYSGITQTTQFRAVVKSGVCAEVNSSAATITVLPVVPVPVALGAGITLGSSVTLTSTGCTGAGLTEKWFKTSDDSPVMMPVSPTVTTSYYAKCERTTGTVICLSSKSNDVSVTVIIPPVISIISGNWEDAATWNVGRIPTATEDVIIDSNHTVTINTIVSAKNVAIRTNGKIIKGSASSKLQIGL